MSTSVLGGIHPSGQTPPQQTATAADGTHPTGMHSCLVMFHIHLSVSNDIRKGFKRGSNQIICNERRCIDMFCSFHLVT